MATDISIITSDTGLVVHTPYDPTFPDRAHELGGRFDNGNRSWTFDPRDEQRVRTLVREIYGTDGGTTEEPLVTLHLDLDQVPGYQAVRLAGRRLAWRPARDDRVRLAKGVVVIKGGFEQRGGSVKNPALAEMDGTILEVRDVPLSVAQKMANEAHGVTIIDADAVKRSALLAERDQLLARLGEIDAVLNSSDGN